MSIVTRVKIVDPDTGEERERISFTFGKPMTQADKEALHKFLVDKSPPGLLEIAKAKLAEIEGLPEYASAARHIETGEHFATLGEWRRVSASVSDFSASYERAMRRAAIRTSRKSASIGGAKSGRSRDRSDKVYAYYLSRLADGLTHLQAIADCQPRFGYKGPTQVRKIIAKLKRA